MGCRYEREYIIPEKSDVDRNQELMDTILQTKKIIKEANSNYEMAEGKLIDYFLYTIKAEQARLDYLIGRAKKMGITIDVGEQLNPKNA